MQITIKVDRLDDEIISKLREIGIDVESVALIITGERKKTKHRGRPPKAAPKKRVYRRKKKVVATKP